MMDKYFFLKNIKSEIEKDNDYGKNWLLIELQRLKNHIEDDNDGLQPVTLSKEDIKRLKQIVWWLEDNE